MKLIGLTGGIGSGKTTVAEYLRRLGYPVLDADLVSREVLKKGSPKLSQLVTHFGSGILLADGELNRKALADIVFQNPKERQYLENVTHGEIIRILLEKSLQLSQNNLVFLDAALLFETGLDQYTDEVWMVDAEEELRIGRVMLRDNTTREHIALRISSQLSREEKKRKSHRILDNTGSKEELYRQIEDLLTSLLERE